MEQIRYSTYSFPSPVQDGICEIENRIRSQAVGYQPDISAAIDLLLLSGGKRIRPAITLLGGRLIGADPQSCLSIAAAIELMHMATLVHDDLIDGSLLRRGSSTLNSRWSPGAAVLTGDFLFARAAMLAAEANSIQVMILFTQTLARIVNGELSQLFSDHCTFDRNTYFQRIYAKTATLFETSAASAALIGHSKPSIHENLRTYGYNVGMAFQIIDDILDFTGQQATLGKPSGSDLHQGIITLPTILFIEDHPDDPLVKLLQKENLRQLNGHIEPIIEAIRTSNSINRAYRIADEYIQKGVDALIRLPDGPDRLALTALAEFIGSRQF